LKELGKEADYSMDMVVKGRHMEVRPDIRAYAEEKVGKAAKLLNSMVMDVEVELYHERNRSIEKNQVAEATIRTKHPGPVIRAREAASDMKAAIDLLAEKLERQALKLKGKLDRKNHARGGGLSEAGAATVEAEDEDGEAQPVIVKTKSMELKPMDSEEAILQLELLGHDFFVFESAENAMVNVLYKRRDGDYGLIVPKEA
jgi:putative sigma-54 modulation protein